MGPRTRAVLARLALAAPRAVGLERLIADVWGESLPQHPTRAVQIAVSRLRSALGAPHRVTWEGHGYRLHVEPDEVDVRVFDERAVSARQLLGEGRHEAALQRFDEALQLWRGPALAGIGDVPFARDEGPPLETRRLEVATDRLEALLSAGRHGETLTELRRLVADHPLEERLRGLLMVALYRNGQQALALEVYRQGRDVLAEQLGVEPGEQLQRLHLAVLRHDPTLQATAAPDLQFASDQAGTAPQVAAALTSLVGRQAEMDEVDGMVSAHRLVTITGTGGSGKSRLAREVARRRGAAHPGGVWMVDLAPLEDGRHVAAAVARTLGVPDDGDQATIVQQLARAVGAQGVLVVLDNAEHVLADAGQVAHRLLARCPQLHLLTTSRQPLDLPGEHRWSLRGLPLPPRRGVTSVELADVPSVRLFLDRATQADRSFTPDEDDLWAIAEVCRQVAGLPLAIELAAAWVRVLPCAAIAEQLDPSSAVLAAAATTPEQRHRSLRRTLDWSHERLDADERGLLWCMSVFRGPMTLPAIEHVLEPTAWAVPDLLSGVRRLVDTSLVEARPRGPDGATFRLLEPIRQYAATHLRESGHETTVRDAHAAWCRAIWQQASAAIRRHEDLSTTPPQLHAWFDELRAALQWCQAMGRDDLAVELLGAACIPWWTHGMLTEGVEWASEVLSRPHVVPSPAWAAALAGAAFLELHLATDPNDPLVAAAEGHARKALIVLEDIGGRERAEVRTLAELALAHAQLRTDGDLAEAEQLVASARREADERADLWIADYARVVTASIAWERGDLDATAATLTELLSVSEVTGATTGLIAAHFNLGTLALEQGDPEQARHHLEAVVALKRRSNTNPFGRNRDEREELALLARACHESGDAPASTRYRRLARDSTLPVTP